MLVTLLVAVAAATGFILILLAAAAWSQRRTALAARALTVLLLSIAGWDLGYAGAASRVPEPTPGFWIFVMFVGIACAPTALVVFSLHFTNRERVLGRGLRLALLLEPAAIVFAAGTDQRWGLLLNGAVGSDLHLREAAGPAFWTHTIYSYMLTAIATTLLVKFRLTRFSALYRTQANAVIVGTAAQWIGSLLMAVDFGEIDLSPFALSISAIAFADTLLRARVLSNIPIARDLLVERMQDGVLVVDVNGRVSDLNPMATQLLGVDAKSTLGQHFRESLHHQPHIAAMLRSTTPERREVDTHFPSQRVLDVTVSKLADARGRDVGSLCILRDVSDRRTLESELAKQALVDPLTGIGNRRMLDDAAQRELERRKRSGMPLALAILDVDFLKRVNDESGHDAGDAALLAVASALTSVSRTTDVAVRMGGDEFALLFPDTNIGQAAEVVERVRRALRERTARDPRLQVLSLSVGIAQADVDDVSTEDLLRAADSALYRAKAAGRDRVVRAD